MELNVNRPEPEGGDPGLAGMTMSGVMVDEFQKV
jgi:hypothetical protein